MPTNIVSAEIPFAASETLLRVEVIVDCICDAFGDLGYLSMVEMI